MMSTRCVVEWTCLWNQLKCTESNLCIDRSLACDGKEDCADGEDEQNCGLYRSHLVFMCLSSSLSLSDQTKVNELMCLPVARSLGCNSINQSTRDL